MVIVQFSGRVSGSGKDPWNVESSAFLITARDISNYRGDLIVKKVGDLWERNFYGGRGVTLYRTARFLTNSHADQS